MPIFEFSQDKIQPLAKTTFAAVDFQERRDLQRLLRENISVIAPHTLIIAEEYGEWDDSRRRIDLLGVDSEANLIVIELKRTEDGGHMELQAIRYAAMVSTMTFDQAVHGFNRYLHQIGRYNADARAELLEFLRWEEPDHDLFAQEVKIILASAEFSLELTTAVLWLNQRELDIRCVRLQPYNLSGRVLVDVQQIIPPPEAAEYQIKVREKVRKEREARMNGSDFTKYNLILGNDEFSRESKRWVILRTFRYLVESGIAPQTVAQHCGKRAGRAYRDVEGKVSHEDFVRLASESRAELGKVFDQTRWFCGDDELMYADGRTYAFSNQWGGSQWVEVMSNLRDVFSHLNISFKPTP